MVASPDSLGKSFDAARECLAEERRRTTDELDSLETFVDEVRTLQAVSVSFDDGWAPVGTHTTHADRGTSGLEAVRAAYEETMMSVPHYDDEYDDTYERSVAEEFGPDLATALTERTTFGDQLKQTVVSAAVNAQASREALLSALDTEDRSIDAADERLRPIAEELAEVTATPLQERTFETLDAYRARLAVLEEHCDDLAARRQSTLLKQRHELWLPVDGPDVPTYAYQSLDVDYPVISALTEVAERIDGTRSSVERAMGYCD